MLDPEIMMAIFGYYSGVLQNVLAGEVTRKLTEKGESHDAASRAEMAELQKSLHGSDTVIQRVEHACLAGMKDVRLDEQEAAILWPLVQDQVFAGELAGELKNGTLSISPEWLLEFPSAAEAPFEAVESVAAKLTQAAQQAIASDPLLAQVLQLQLGSEIRSIVRHIDALTVLLPGIDQKLDSLLGVGNLPSSSGSPKEDASELRSQIAKAFSAASTGLLSWPTTLDDGQTRLEPKQAEEARAGFSEPNGSTTLLLGGPGSGKSALLATLGSALVKAGQTTLAVKADTLPTSVNSLAALGKHLDLPHDPLSCIQSIAKTEDVFVLVDQLDALADLVDLHSGRLNVLLHLIRSLADHPRIHVLASCRDFEHRHDVRLTAINARPVHLELPTWEEVAAVLAQRGLPQAAGWPQALRDLLRSPQHLKVFLSLLRGGTEPELFSSYQKMMETLWTQRVTNRGGLPGRSEFLDTLATRMANEETLWLPSVQYEGQTDLVEQLEAGEILVHSADGLSLGFRHQTLFNHARARAFARDQHGHGGLAAYVLARQDALFVRPTLWSSLMYLRGADRTGFRREFASLWSSSNLRLHVRLLLLDFLGQLEDPDDQEAGWLLPALEDEGLRGRVLRSTAGRKGWFERLSQAYLPMLMGGGNAQDLNDVTLVLSEAWRTAHGEVLALVQRHWEDDPGKDSYTWSALESLGQWEPQTVNLVCRLIERGEVADSRVMGLVSTVSVAASTLAPQIVAAALEVKLARLLAHPAPRPELPGNATEAEAMLWEWRHSPEREFRTLLEQGTGWYALAEVAEAAPAEYLTALWPWFLKVLKASVSPPNKVLRIYSHDAGQGVLGESSVLDSFEDALVKLAGSHPEAFLSFAAQWGGEDLSSVQQMLARGMTKLASTHPEAALDFLLADVRRFKLGEIMDSDGDTTALISALVPHLSAPQRQRLERAILAWAPHFVEAVRQEPPEERRRFAKWEREARLRLLTAFAPGHLSNEAHALVVQEKRALPRALERGMTMREGTVESPMSVEQMFKARDEDVLALFSELTDQTEWDHPRREDFLIGGSIQAARVLGELAKKQPDRVVGLVQTFSPGQQERPVAYALEGLAESALPAEDLTALILTLDRRGFHGDEFRIHAAWALDKLLGKGHQLPETICILLENWLEEMQAALPTGGTAANAVSVEPPAGSILWDHGTSEILPQGTFTVLETLSRAYLLRKPMEADRWLTLLEHHLTGPESEATWKALWRFLPYLSNADRGRAKEFLHALFTRYPGVRDGTRGARLLARIRSWADPEFVRRSVEAMRDSGWSGGHQAYAELLPLLAVLPLHRWAAEELDAVLATAGDTSSASISLRVGVAHAGAHLWTEPAFKEMATRILRGLMASAHPDVCRAVVDVFRVADSLHPDKFTRELLEALLAYPSILEVSDTTFVIDRLNDVLPSRPGLALQLAELLVAQLGAKPPEVRSASPLPTAELVNLAMTIQRLEGDFRVRGLELFERLLMLNVYEARGTLTELDNRPTATITPMRRRLPRRPRRRRA